MEIGLAILLFVCMTALLYVILSLKITRQVDLQIKEFYKSRIHSDMQEFYREMEGYAALMENRIQRFKSLVERSDSAAQPEAPMPPTPVERPVKPAAIPPAPTRSRAATQQAKPSDQRQKKNQVAGTKKQTRGTATRAIPVAPTAEKRPARLKPAPMPEPVAVAPVEDFADDTAIAEELMKDLFARDELQLSSAGSRKAAAEAPVQNAELRGSATTAQDAGAAPVAGFFARIGKAVQPVIFGEKPRAPDPVTQHAPEPKAAATPAEPQPRGTTDFTEVLRRAEQIKAEKKAERERAEIEARAEFYAGGDAFASSSNPAMRPPVMKTEAKAPAQATAPRSVAAVAERIEPARNNLAVRSLDEHTISFLIDSLKNDQGYRRQALRALTENNISLEEIAQLSRIDIGELQLMRQLGRF